MIAIPWMACERTAARGSLELPNELAASPADQVTGRYSKCPLPIRDQTSLAATQGPDSTTLAREFSWVQAMEISMTSSCERLALALWQAPDGAPVFLTHVFIDGDRDGLAIQTIPPIAPTS